MTSIPVGRTRSTIAATFGSLLALSTQATQAESQLDHLLAQGAALTFDAGTAQRHYAGSQLLESDSLYAPQRGYGWLPGGKTPELLQRDELSRSRDDLTIDSLGGEELRFRIDLPKGEWLLNFWMESGTEFVNTATVTANGRPLALNWHKFERPAEPVTSLRPEYRLWQGPVSVDKDSLELVFKGGEDEVRLNGLQFVRAGQAPTPTRDIGRADAQDLLRLKAAGHFNSTESLDAIAIHFRNRLAANPADQFAAYWLPQVEALARAEEYFEGLRGWEWARMQTGLSMFGRYNQAIMLIDGLLSTADKNHPLYERARYQRGRLLYWIDRESHGRHHDGWIAPDLAYLAGKHPQDNLLKMYVGGKIDEPDVCDKLSAAEQAPAWSEGQSEMLCRTRLLSNWWVQERQDENGELGGKYGDDVEMLRWWALPFLAGDPVTAEGWRKLATGVWHSDRLEDGYFKKPKDVEHASEPISDTLPLLSYLGDPLYVERLSHSARHFLERWTVEQDGARLFKSAWFGAHTIDERPPRNRDVPMNGRAAKAVMYYAWATGNERVISGLHEWAKGWRKAAMSDAKGKPAGLIPASVRAADGSINGDEPNWYDANMFWDYFNWEHESGQQIYDLFLSVAQLTGDDSLLQPLYASADLVAAHLAASPKPAGEYTKGSRDWAAATLASQPGFWSVLEQWRLLYDDRRYDALLMEHGSAYIKFRLSGDDRQLADAATPILDSIRYNFPMRTSEALFTDRVYISEEDAVPANLGMLTGGVRTSAPYAAVTWQDAPDGFAALVRDSSRDRLTVELFINSEAEHAPVNLRLWQLAAGDYHLSLKGSGADIHGEQISVVRPGQQLEIDVPARKRVALTIARR
ncbi:hypothetical protein [Microbulbifer magnicolonia]|uniref:hypothetical protein n=1 Tax=Microbulbifer magnicolonia TaxID=3109744 RepID=UPI002B403825|nr:hypothetical protein [Microbulbifer sp. GG15]